MISRGPGRIAKTLSANDIGRTGGHQGGILIPKTGGVLPFFPALDERALNPRAVVRVVVPDLGSQIHKLTFIYYNNKAVSGGTRDEYRLTGMTSLLRSIRPEVGDILILRRGAEGPIEAHLERTSDRPAAGVRMPARGRSESASGWFIVEIE